MTNPTPTPDTIRVDMPMARPLMLSVRAKQKFDAGDMGMEVRLSLLKVSLETACMMRVADWCLQAKRNGMTGKEYRDYLLHVYSERHPDTDGTLLPSKLDKMAEVLGSQGDVLQFKSETRGTTARSFNNFAEAVAVLALAEGGVSIFGDTYEIIAHAF